ncbi:MAG: hypothetical protein AB8G96_02060 [Phycisphaerales bacterium]
MAHIEQVGDADATGRLARIYAAARDRADGVVAGIIRVMSRDVASLEGSMAFYLSVMKTPNALPPAQRELLAAVVSNVNDCYY